MATVEGEEHLWRQSRARNTYGDSRGRGTLMATVEGEEHLWRLSRARNTKREKKSRAGNIREARNS
jgi:hypothetical protein